VRFGEKMGVLEYAGAPSDLTKWIDGLVANWGKVALTVGFAAVFALYLVSATV